FFVLAEDGIRDFHVTGVQTCALPISGDALAAVPVVEDAPPVVAPVEARQAVLHQGPAAGYEVLPVKVRGPRLKGVKEGPRQGGVEGRPAQQPQQAIEQAVFHMEAAAALLLRAEERRVGRGCGTL